MRITVASKELKTFREEVYKSFEHRGDALMELLDALASNQNAKSVVELSLSPHFHRQYGSVFDAIDNYLFAGDPDELTLARRVREAQLLKITAPYLPPPTTRTFWLFAVDATSVRRQYAHTLADRTYVYQPNSLAGNKPVTIGHQYTTIACLPEREPYDPAWVVPMAIRRISSEQTETQIGAEVVANLFADDALPWVESGALLANLGDSKYRTVPFLSPLAAIDNLVNIVRIRGNRVLYRLPEPVNPEERKRGRPRRYVVGLRRAELSLSEIWLAYRQRYDIEHFFRFGKQRLLMADFETSDVNRSENWMHLVQLAYVQLFMTRGLAESHPRPWERYLPIKNNTVASPSQTQRNFSRIIDEIGTPARPPKTRGKSPGLGAKKEQY